MAGVAGVLLYLAGVLIVGERPPFDASGAEVAAHIADEQTRSQVGVAVMAASMPFFVWFFASVAARAADAGEQARHAATAAFGCGLVFVTLFLADIATIAVGALRPENMVANPEVASALYDIEFMLMGVAAFMGAGLLAAYALLVLRSGARWPRWVGWLAAVAAPLYLLRAATLFTTDGVFAADGLLGVYVPVAALAGWVFVASVSPRSTSASPQGSAAR